MLLISYWSEFGQTYSPKNVLSPWDRRPAPVLIKSPLSMARYASYTNNRWSCRPVASRSKPNCRICSSDACSAVSRTPVRKKLEPDLPIAFDADGVEEIVISLAVLLEVRAQVGGLAPEHAGGAERERNQEPAE